MKKTDFITEPGSLEVTMTRVFDAPPGRVYAAYTDPALIPKWWGPRAYTVIVRELDARIGGRWRFDVLGPAGDISSFRGVYHDCREPTRLVFTLEYDGMPADVLLDTVRFEDIGNMTRVVSQSIFQSLRAKEEMIRGGAEEGGAEGWDRLEQAITEGA